MPAKYKIHDEPFKIASTQVVLSGEVMWFSTFVNPIWQSKIENTR